MDGGTLGIPLWTMPEQPGRKGPSPDDRGGPLSTMNVAPTSWAISARVAKLGFRGYAEYPPRSCDGLKR